MAGGRALVESATRAAAEALTLAELAHAIAPLGDALAAPIAVLYWLLPDETLDGLMCSGPPEALRQYGPWQRSDPLRELKARTNLRLGVTTDLVDARRLRRSEVYTEFYAPLGVEHQLVARLSPVGYPDPGAVMLVLCRLTRQRPWSRAETEALGRVLPAFEAAARRAARFTAVERERGLLRSIVEQRAAGAYAAFTLDGALVWCSPRAETDLGPIPDDLRARVRLLGSQWAGAGTVVADTRVRFVGAGARELSGELFVAPEGPHVVLRLDPGTAAHSPVARAAVHYQLRPSEARVYDALSRGLSNAAIGRELFISRETVRTHVHRILSRTHSRSRLEAVTKLKHFA